MQVLVVGSGKLARELLGEMSLEAPLALTAWVARQPGTPRAIVVHAGSGRELDEVIAYCAASGSTLIELATGSAVEQITLAFPVVLCPNTNILMLKFMHMLAQAGPLFAGSRCSLLESHQAEKRSTPGTALAMAESLGLAAEAVVSVREPAVQRALGIPAEHLARHAAHFIQIEDAACSIRIETRVVGDTPYADGVARIVQAAARQALQARLYPVSEFVAQGWL